MPALLRLPRFLWLAMTLASLVVGFAWAEQRFPPPEFESGHQLPVTTTPPARSLTLQYLDVAVLLGTLGVATYLVHRRRSRRSLVWLSLFSVTYFGFYREGCVCAIGSPQNVVRSLVDPQVPLPLSTLLFFAAPLVFALFAGRTFCAGVCPHGALQDLLLIKPVKVPAWLEQTLGVIPFIFLGLGLVFAATGSTFLFCRYDPFVPFFRMSGPFLIMMIGAAFIVLGLFVGRPYCRFLCPYGALLRLASLASRWRVRITPDYCTQCRLCEESCPYGAIRHPSTPPSNPAALTPDRRRLGRLLLLVPLVVVAGAWLGSQLSTRLAQSHPTVALAERFADPKRKPPPPGPATPDSLAITRAEKDPQTLLTTAATLRRQFNVGGWLFGAWLGLVVGTRLVTLSLRTTRTDFEPDRGTCFACARCFLSCPNERVRLGLMPASALPAGPVPPPNTCPTAKTPSASPKPTSP